MTATGSGPGRGPDAEPDPQKKPARAGRPESPEARSRTMRAVKGRDTQPERIVRRITHALGYGYRLHRKELPGRPDLAFIGRRKAIFVHGCFWHGHDCRRGARVPKNNRDYWLKKIAGNRARDQRHAEALAAMGWRRLVIWECALRDVDALRETIRRFLEG